MLKASNTITRSQNRCDRCVQLHRKCDRLLPKCLYCEKRQKECSYPNKNAYGKQLYMIEENILSFKVIDPLKQNNKKKKEKRVFVMSVIKTHRKNKPYKCSLSSKNNSSVIDLVNKHEQVKSPDNSRELCTSFGSFQNIHRIMSLRNIITLPKSSPTIAEAMYLSALLKSSINLAALVRKHWTSYFGIFNFENINYFNSIINKAIDNYFAYNNKTFPMFVRENFKLSSKNETLRMAILVCGLKYMEKCEIASNLMEYFEAKLRMVIGIPHQIKPSLSNLQSIAALLVGFNSITWIRDQFELYLAIFEKLAQTLGLHMTYKNMDAMYKLERAMTYSSITMIQLAYKLVSGSYFSKPERPRYLSIKYTEILDRLLICKIVSTEGQNSKAFDLDCNIILSSFYNDFSLVTFSILLLKESHIKLGSCDSSLTRRIFKLMNKADFLRSHYYKLLILVGVDDNSKAYRIKVLRYQQIILFFSHYLKFIIQSLKFPQIYTLNNHNQSKEMKESDYFNTILTECYLVINYGIRLPSYHMFHFGLGMIIQCLIFLLKYKGKSMLNFNGIIKDGINYMNGLSSINNFYNLATDNIESIEYSKVK